jgi:hypothetical protein
MCKQGFCRYVGAYSSLGFNGVLIYVINVLPAWSLQRSRTLSPVRLYVFLLTINIGIYRTCEGDERRGVEPRELGEGARGPKGLPSDDEA